MTLPELLLRTAKKYPEYGIEYTRSDGSYACQTYTDLLRQAKELLAHLQANGCEPGHKVIAQLTTSRELITFFWGCVLGGIVPILLPKVHAWQRQSESKRKFINIWELLKKPLVYVGKGDANVLISQTRQEGMAALNCLEMTFDSSHADARLYSADPDELAFLQFSSGSTGIPKGVRLTHRNLSNNIEDIVSTAAWEKNEIALSWMPYFHDMGLIGFHLVPLYCGSKQIKMEAAHFISNPLSWFQQIDKHRATMISSPNFGLRHVLDRITTSDLQGMDLSCVKLLYNGAEPIAAQTMQKFISLVEVAKFSTKAMFPVYGMAEACLAVAFSPLHTMPHVHRLNREQLVTRGIVSEPNGVRDDDVVEYVDVGYPLPSMQLRIADHEGLQLAEGRVGEIQIRGVNVTSGYEADGDANRELYTKDGWLHTGDLGFLKAGRLVVTGRLKDIVFVNGQNIMAHDIEQAISEQCGIKPGTVAVCGVRHKDNSTEGVLVFLAIRKKKDLWPLLNRIKQQAQDYLGFTIDHVIPVKVIPKTTSGKIQRFKLRCDYEQGVFDEHIKKSALQWAGENADEKITLPANQQEQAILDIWAEVLRLPKTQIGVDISFMSLGGSSVKAIEMLTHLETHVGHYLGYEIIIQCHTIREMADFLAQQTPQDDHNHCQEEGAKRVEIKCKCNDSRVAVISMAGRFPDADTLETFWDNLVAAKHSVRAVPDSRWRSKRRRYYMGLLEGADQFAAEFFDITEQEARVMDPQQRLMLEVVYEVLEHAGYCGARKNEQRTGVYLGVSYNTYLEQILPRVQGQFDKQTVNAHTLTGNLLNMVAARVAHVLNLKGPALTFDTACSSSLVALHYACNDLILGHSDMALAGGVNLLLTSTVHELFDEAGALSPDGVCRAFDHKANGMVPGEGLGVVLLKRLDRAIADGDNILGIIEATAVNNDGSSIGVMAPNPEGQEAVLRCAYEQAGVPLQNVSYIEAHGTGTAIGDPMEVRALQRVFGKHSQPEQHCTIGSIKTNIGHLLAAAGIAGLIKTLLAMRYELIPPSLHFNRAHPQIRFEKCPFNPALQVQPWPKGKQPRYAGVSSFGFGGTNAHVVLSDAIPLQTQIERQHSAYHLVGLSAKSQQDLVVMCRQLASYLQQQNGLRIADVCFTRNAGREEFQHRKFAIVRDVDELIKALETNDRNKELEFPGLLKKGKRKVAFIFGSEAFTHSTMLGRYYQLYPVFRETVDYCVNSINRHTGMKIELWKILLQREQEQFPYSDVLTIGVFIVNYALAKMWVSWGVQPSVLLAYGIGQFAAACVAGVVNLDDALKMAMQFMRLKNKARDSIEFQSLLAELSSIEFKQPKIRMIPGVRGEQETNDIHSPDYWVRLFNQANGKLQNEQALGDLDACFYLELWPHDAFKDRFLSRIKQEKVAQYGSASRILHSVATGNNEQYADERIILQSLACLWLAGWQVNWREVERGFSPKNIYLPSYPMVRKKYGLPNWDYQGEQQPWEPVYE